MKTLNKAVARYNGISLIIRILIGLIIGAVLALVAPNTKILINNPNILTKLDINIFIIAVPKISIAINIPIVVRYFLISIIFTPNLILY